MDSNPNLAPYFEPRVLGGELESLLARHGSVAAARPAAVERLKELLRTARAAAARQLASDGNGRRCAERLALLHAALLRLVFDYTINHVYRAINPSDGDRGHRRFRPASPGPRLRSRSVVCPALQADALGGERGGVPALSAVGSGFEGRARHAVGGTVAEAFQERYHHPHRPARCPLHSR